MNCDHCVGMEHPPTFDIAQGNHLQPEQLPSGMQNSRERKRSRMRDWEEAETSALLKCVNLPQFRHKKRNQSYMKWDAIAEEIQKRLVQTDSAITGKRCKERMKTLRGYYQQVVTKKKKAGVTEDEWRKSNGIAVAWWYKAIGDFRGPREGKSIGTQNAIESANKKIIVPLSVVELTMSHMHHNNLNFCKEYNALCPSCVTLAKRFNSLNDLRRSTLLDLYLRAHFLEERGDCDNDWDHLELCEWLSIVQNRSCLAIYEDVIALEKLGLVITQSDDEMGEGSDHEGVVSWNLCIVFSSLRAHEEFYQKVLVKNPAYDTHRSMQYEAMVTFDATCAPSGITVLHIHYCEELEMVDVSGFRKLRSLSIQECRKLREIIGCECLEELGWLEMDECPSYHGYPPLQKIPSLQEFRFSVFCFSTSRVNPGGELDVSGCVRLRTLEIKGDDALSSIRGLEGLHSLRRLSLWRCIALGNLADIGHMKDLTYMAIGLSAVEEIKGVEKLSSLKQLLCYSSKLKTLPDLSHLPHLQSVHVDKCPVVDDPSSSYYQQRDTKYFNRQNKHVEVSDISDTERDLSDPGD